MLLNLSASRSIYVLAVSRLFINMTRRFAYPFLPAIGRGLNVPLSQIQNTMAVQAGIGIISPLSGPFAETHGRRRVMLFAAMLMIAAAIVGVLGVNMVIFFIVMVAFGVVKIVFDPAMQAYIGDRISYQGRAQAIGITELAWAGSLLVAAPITGYLLGTHGLQLVFLMFIVLGILTAVLLLRYVPPDHGGEGEGAHKVSLRDAFGTIRRSRTAMGAIGFAIFLTISHEGFFIVYGAWLESTYALSLAGLGMATIVIGVAEVAGEMMVIGLADRFGKRRLTLIGTAGSAICYLGIPLLDFHLAGALAGVFVLFVFIELAIVGSIPWFTEILPDARAVMMTGNVAAHSVGRFIGAAMIGFVYRAGGFWASSLLSMALGMGAFVVLWYFVPEFQSSSNTTST